MIEVDWKWVLTTLAIPASVAVYAWLTRVWWPTRQKQASDAATSSREFNETTQGSAFAQVLDTQRQLIKHIIDSNNGHLSALTVAVTAGDKAHLVELQNVTAGINRLLILMSQRPADFRGLDNSADDPRTATIKSPADKRADAIVEAAGGNEGASDGAK